MTGAPVGFAGPVGLKIPVYCDNEVAGLPNFVVGANEVDQHYRTSSTRSRLHRRPGRATSASRPPAIAARAATSGTFRGYRGIEVGHVFFLGTKYSEAMKANFLDADGKEKPMIMGCYGIGVTRIAAAAIEQNHDDDGIIWPMPIAPFEVNSAVAAGQRRPGQRAVRSPGRSSWAPPGIDVLYDDRDERPGVKFKDADLIGIPWRIAVGKKGVAEGVVEVKARRSPEVEKVKIEEAVAYVRERMNASAGHVGEGRDDDRRQQHDPAPANA